MFCDDINIIVADGGHRLETVIAISQHTAEKSSGSFSNIG